MIYSSKYQCYKCVLINRFIKLITGRRNYMTQRHTNENQNTSILSSHLMSLTVSLASSLRKDIYVKLKQVWVTSASMTVTQHLSGSSDFVLSSYSIGSHVISAGKQADWQQGTLSHRAHKGAARHKVAQERLCCGALAESVPHMFTCTVYQQDVRKDRSRAKAQLIMFSSLASSCDTHIQPS